MNNLYKFSNKEGTSEVVISVANVICFVINDTTKPNIDIIYSDFCGSTPLIQHLNKFTYDDIRIRLKFVECTWVDVNANLSTEDVTSVKELLYYSTIGSFKGRIIFNRDYILSIEPTEDANVTKVYLVGLKPILANIPYKEMLKIIH